MIFVYHNDKKYGIQFEYEFEAVTNKDIIVRNTTCMINLLHEDGEIRLLADGQAWQHPQDIFVKEIGRKIAMKHALSQISDKGLRTKIWEAYFNRGRRAKIRISDNRDNSGRVFGEGC
jgi:hypothetical protein